jgi:putative ABC transport system ATP-binding protein
MPTAGASAAAGVLTVESPRLGVDDRRECRRRRDRVAANLIRSVLIRMAPASPTTAPPVIVADQLAKTFAPGSGNGALVAAVQGVSFSVAAGEMVAIIGASGSGKSTILHMLGGITRPTSGRVLLEGVDLAALDDDKLAIIRRRRIGFIFQRYNLLPELSLVENVALPLVLDGRPERECRERALEAIAAVGLEPRSEHRPDALSGGEQQRGAIARGLVTRPAVVLADEPTGALDSGNARAVLRLLTRLVADRGLTVVLVTHDPLIAATANRAIRIVDGLITGPDGESPMP